jgi:hypothetical protein
MWVHTPQATQQHTCTDAQRSFCRAAVVFCWYSCHCSSSCCSSTGAITFLR